MATLGTVSFDQLDQILNGMERENIPNCAYPWKGREADKKVIFYNKRFSERLRNYMSGQSNKLISLPSRVTRLKDMPYVLECDPVIRGDDCVYHDNEMKHNKIANPFAGISASPIIKYTDPSDKSRSKTEAKWYSTFRNTSGEEVAKSRRSTSDAPRLSPREAGEVTDEKDIDTPKNVTKRRPKQQNQIIRQFSGDALDLTAVEDDMTGVDSQQIAISTGRGQLTVLEDSGGHSEHLGSTDEVRSSKRAAPRRDGKDDRGRSKSLLVQEAEALAQPVMPRLVEDGMKHKLNAIYGRK